LKQNNLIIDKMVLHEHDKLEAIHKGFVWGSIKLVWGFLIHRYEKYLHILDQVADYYGEKHAFYIAFLIHF